MKHALESLFFSSFKIFAILPLKEIRYYYTPGTHRLALLRENLISFIYFPLVTYLRYTIETSLRSETQIE